MKSFITRRILNQNNHNASDFDENSFFKSMILKKIYIFEKHDFEEKFIFKTHDFEEKKFLKKQIFKKILHTQNHVLIHFTP